MRTKHVLVVDDEDIVREPISAMAGTSGFLAVDTAESGQEAIEKFKNNSYSFLLTDIRMPGIDGLELISIIKEKFPDICAIAMTEYTQRI